MKSCQMCILLITSTISEIYFIDSHLHLLYILPREAFSVMNCLTNHLCLFWKKSQLSFLSLADLLTAIIIFLIFTQFFHTINIPRLNKKAWGGGYDGQNKERNEQNNSRKYFSVKDRIERKYFILWGTQSLSHEVCCLCFVL